MCIRDRKGSEPIAFLWEKYTTKHLVDAGTFRRVDEYRSPWPSFVIVATEAVLTEHPKEVQRLLKVIRDQVSGLMQKKTAPEMVAQRYKMSLEDAREWFASVKWNTDGKVDADGLARVVETLLIVGMLSKEEADEFAARLVLVA